MFIKKKLLLFLCVWSLSFTSHLFCKHWAFDLPANSEGTDSPCSVQWPHSIIPSLSWVRYLPMDERCRTPIFLTLSPILRVLTGGICFTVSPSVHQYAPNLSTGPLLALIYDFIFSEYICSLARLWQGRCRGLVLSKSTGCSGSPGLYRNISAPNKYSVII